MPYTTERVHIIGKSGLFEYGGGLSFVIMNPGDTVTGIEGATASYAYHWLKGTGLAVGGFWYLPIDHVMVPGTVLDRHLLGHEIDQGTVNLLCTLESTPATGTSPAFTAVDSVTVNNVGGSGRTDTAFVFGQAPVVHGCLHSGGHKRYRVKCEIVGMSAGTVPGIWAIYELPFTYTAATQAALVGDATG